MCVRYRAPAEIREVELEWEISYRNPGAGTRWWDEVLFPNRLGPFIRRERNSFGYSKELVVGQWGLIPWFAKEAKLKFPTSNARSEELAEKASYKHPWSRGQRCIIPAIDFDEPNWESGKNQWWRFKRADGRLWGLAGLWNTWIDPQTGEPHESYTMLTANADAHPLMSRMHKPDTKLPADQQDKRSVIPLAPEDYDQWLAGTLEEAQALLRVPPIEVFDARPVEAGA